MRMLALAFLVACTRTPPADLGKEDPDALTDDADADGFSAEEGDCDDADASAFPGAQEACDGLDQDCDGVVDNGVLATWYADADGDGVGDAATAIEACEAVDGQISTAGDCDDTRADVFPGAPEACDGADNDCDGSTDEDGASPWYADADGDGFGDPASEDVTCAPASGWISVGSDCDDGDATSFPGATEVCDEEDNDCDGTVDEDVTTTWWADLDGDDHGGGALAQEACAQPAGYVASADDCDDAAAGVNPDAAEVCDGVDQDCDGAADDGVTTTYWPDRDGDAHGDAAVSVEACELPVGYASVSDDCDDLDASAFAGAFEACDGVDNDCDGSADEGVLTTFYADADGDGHGDASAPDLACAAPAGHVASADDCDDADATAFPGAAETCDSIDNDCDGSADEGVLVTFYADADADGHGDATAPARACAAPAGHVTSADDCDDADATTFPGASETCDTTDNDCDGSVDEGVQTTFYADGDADGWGLSSSTTLACAAPAGTTARGGDCDDARSTVNPGATEVCNGRDDDCDGTSDESDAADAASWYTDADGDTYGAAGTGLRACTAPAGRVASATDCDDARATRYPGAPELRDGLDNDCDGTADDSLHRGTGLDGPLVVTGTTLLSATGDAPSWSVTAMGTSTVTLDAPATGLAAGDEVLVVNLQGTDSAYGSVGRYTFASVASTSGSTVTLSAPITTIFGAATNADLAGQVIVLQRVPHYTDVTIGASGVLTTAAWDGLEGGILAFRASGTIEVANGGQISVAGLGYAGGGTGLADNCDSFQGESLNGPGDGAAFGTCAAYNEAYGLWAANVGGGGAHICGGGGNYGGSATDSDSWTGGSATPAYAGATYGAASLGTLHFGSGGGGVWWGAGPPACVGTGPGPGGDGGGLVVVTGATLRLLGSHGLVADGASTTACAKGSWEYGAGGGAGGSAWIVADTVSLAAESVHARGGSGEQRNVRRGGNGGVGRVRIDCTTCNGFAAGSAAAATALGSASTPDAGYAGTP